MYEREDERREVTHTQVHGARRGVITTDAVTASLRRAWRQNGAPFVAAALTIGAALAPTACGVPGASRSASGARHEVILRANQPSTFTVDGVEVGRGRSVRVTVADGPHDVSARAEGYVALTDTISPPYRDGYARQFFFLVEHQLRTPDPVAASATAATAPVPPRLPAGTSTPTGVPRIWTVAVGVSRFHERSIALQFADRDAQGVDTFFASEAGGAVPAERRALLTNEGATRSAILNALTTVAKRTAPDDMLVLFLATHGLPDGGGDLYFLAHDTDPKALVGTGLPQRDVEYALSRAQARRVVLLADACHSGAAGFSGFRGTRGLELAETNRLVEKIAEAKPGIAVLTAASATEASMEGPAWGGGHGVFSFHVLRGLAGGADANQDRFITVRELYDFVYREVSADTKGGQHPELKGTFDNSLPLSRVP